MQSFEHSLAEANAHLTSLHSSMMAELEADPAFLPSAFWRDLNEKNLQMLSAEGLDNFKRTVSQNYYNWLIVNPFNPHFRHILKDWLKHPTLRPLFTRIERDLSVRLTTRVDRLALSAPQRFLYRLYVSCVWEKMLRYDVAGLASRVSEPEEGNPIRVWHDGKIITQDLANSILEVNLLGRFLSTVAERSRVAEFGAGSGRLAHVFASTDVGTYHIFDIPPALLVSQWYLKRVLPHKRIFHFRHFDAFDDISAELTQADLAFFTANQLAKFPQGYFDMMISISTLPEAKPEQVKLFLDLFQKLSRNYIYLKQWRSWKNPLDGTELGSDDYVFASPWKVVLDGINPINPLFFSRVWQRL